MMNMSLIYATYLFVQFIKSTFKLLGNCVLKLSCLHMAATDTQPEIVELLLEHGANPNAVTSDGATPLHCAFQYCAFEIAKLLIKGGADVTMRTSDGQSPFEVTPVDSIEVTPFTTKQLQELRSLVASSSINGGMMIPALSARDITMVAGMDDASVDFEEMRTFFKQAGLGSMEAKLCAHECLNRGAKTSKKLAACIHMNLFTLRDIIDSAGGETTTVNGQEVPGTFDDLDCELVNIAINKLISELYFVSEDGSMNGSGEDSINFSKNVKGSPSKK